NVGGEHVMLQTTTKTRRSQTIHRWDALHQAFLDQLQSKTATKIAYEASDFAADVDFLKANLDELPDWAQESMRKALADVERRYGGRQVDFMAYHADFTPWNMFVEDGRLFVFDWEYSRMTYPCGLDRYHFELQTAYFERHATAQEAFSAVESAPWFSKASCLDYLVGIVSLYLRREGKEIESNPMLKYWIELIKINLCK
ncbi:MAG: phosphotransferase, partial [Bacteroidales bacterium]|nr:phosphotransferase [Bacteroidales bacterium]